MTIAEGLLTGRFYKPSEIDDKDSYEQMVIEPLINVDGTTVVPVRKTGAPHFRRLGVANKVIDLPRKEDSTRHNDTIAELIGLLNDPARSFEIYTHVYIDDVSRVKKDQVIACSRNGINVLWFKENKIRFDDFTSIQPDISARDITRMSPTGASPSFIIEVIDSHYPEPRTFEKLMALSRAAYHVYFYILGNGKINKAHQLNGFRIGKTVRARFTFALLNGELVKNSKVLDLGVKYPSAEEDAPNQNSTQAKIDDPDAERKREAAYHVKRARAAQKIFVELSEASKNFE